MNTYRSVVLPAPALHVHPGVYQMRRCLDVYTVTSHMLRVLAANITDIYHIIIAIKNTSL